MVMGLLDFEQQGKIFDYQCQDWSRQWFDLLMHSLIFQLYLRLLYLAW
jgi:hypothetical protein